jgi:hypothetical protein
MDHDIVLFEQQSLEALQHNYPQLQRLAGSVAFMAEADSLTLTLTAWHFSEVDNAVLKQKGIKAAILELLDTLVEQRKMQRIRPNREGRLVIQHGVLEIDWLTEGSTSLSTYEQAS